MHTSFKQFLTASIPVDADIKDLISKVRTTEVPKGTFLLRQGEIISHTFFVEKGLLRYFSIDEKGKEHILQFAPETWFLSDRESVYFRNPSQYFIQALEDSRVVLLDEKLFSDLSRKNPLYADFNSRLLHNHIRHLHNRINQLLSFTAEERYLEFLRIYPDVFMRVPQSMVASYLGITPESLSRVRKDLSEKASLKSNS